MMTRKDSENQHPVRKREQKPVKGSHKTVKFKNFHLPYKFDFTSLWQEQIMETHQI
jgi:hypothetical protein